MSKGMNLSEQFLLSFNALKNEANDNPQTLITFFPEKQSLIDLSLKVRDAAGKIEQVGDLRKYHPQVPTQFISDWKKYLREWKKAIDYVSYVDSREKLSTIFDLDEAEHSFEAYKNRSPIKKRYDPDPDFEEDFNPSTHEGRKAISELINLAEQERDTHRDFDDDPVNYRLANTWSIGIQAVNFIKEPVGIDLGGVFDRWNKVPTIFVPSHVSNHHGLTEKHSLYGLLEEARKAYVAGAPIASVAMCRAIMEMVLKKHYLRDLRNPPSTLEGVSEIAVSRYDFLQKNRLDALRKRANKALHNNMDKQSTTELEDALIGFFKDIKFWIEKAPD